MSVTNAISSVIIVGAIIAGLAGNSETIFNTSSIFGFLAISLASINIFGGFLVTQRMLAMYKKKRRINSDIRKFISSFLFDFRSAIYFSIKRSFIT
jgi:NAD/NADP transhydrogenase alpha subunit